MCLPKIGSFLKSIFSIGSLARVQTDSHAVKVQTGDNSSGNIVIDQSQKFYHNGEQKEYSLTDVEKRLLEVMQGVSFSVSMLARMARLNEKCTESLLDDLQVKGLVLAEPLPSSMGRPKKYRYHLSEKGKKIVEKIKSSHEK